MGKMQEKEKRSPRKVKQTKVKGRQKEHDVDNKILDKKVETDSVLNEADAKPAVNDEVGTLEKSDKVKYLKI